MVKDELTQSTLKDNLEYSRDTGLFRRVYISSNRVHKGWFSGADNGTGHRRIRVGGKSYLAHRLAFLYETGGIPKLIDHIDNNPSNNKWGNLRECNKSENARNSKLSSASTSGFKGVSWHKRDKKWAVNVNTGFKYKSFGVFDDFELACLVAGEAREKYHGEFTNHG